MKLHAGAAFWLVATCAMPCLATERPLCEGALQVVAECFTVHGRLSLYQGTPSFRIWRIGTHEILGILDTATQGSSESPWLPPAVVTLGKIDPDRMAVSGDYLVCPLSRARSGEMQYVCVESASHLVAQRLNSN